MFQVFTGLTICWSMLVCGMQIRDAIKFYHENITIEEIDARNSFLFIILAFLAWSIVIACLGCVIWLNIYLISIDPDGINYTSELITYNDTQGYVFCGFFAILAVLVVSTWIFVLL